MNSFGTSTPRATSEPTVLLPCPPDQFREFIAGLLGRPQSISKSLRGPFEVTRADIESLYHLVDQRISSKNDATLIQFTARVAYDDNSSVLLNSFSDFQSYNEVRPLTSIGINLGWTWLIKFRNQQFPEKQQIDVGLFTDNRDRAEFAIEFPPSARRIFASYRTGMTLQIAHTDRTWGTDIEGLLSGNLKMLRRPSAGLRRFAYSHSGKIGLGVTFLVFGFALLAAYTTTNAFVDRYLAAARILAGKNELNLAQVSERIDFLINIIASGLWARYAVYVVVLFFVSVIVSIICGVAVGGFADTTRPSFVLLTKKSGTDRIAQMRRYENSWWAFIGAVTGSIIVSIVGNYVFYKIMQLWSLSSP